MEFPMNSGRSNTRVTVHARSVLHAAQTESENPRLTRASGFEVAHFSGKRENWYCKKASPFP